MNLREAVRTLIDANVSRETIIAGLTVTLHDVGMMDAGGYALVIYQNEWKLYKDEQVEQARERVADMGDELIQNAERRLGTMGDK